MYTFYQIDCVERTTKYTDINAANEIYPRRSWRWIIFATICFKVICKSMQDSQDSGYSSFDTAKVQFIHCMFEYIHTSDSYSTQNSIRLFHIVQPVNCLAIKSILIFIA